MNRDLDRRLAHLEGGPSTGDGASPPPVDLAARIEAWEAVGYQDLLSEFCGRLPPSDRDEADRRSPVPGTDVVAAIAFLGDTFTEERRGEDYSSMQAWAAINPRHPEASRWMPVPHELDDTLGRFRSKTTGS